MLTAGVAAALVLPAVLAMVPAASGVSCPPQAHVCIVDVSTPGGPGNASGSGNAAAGGREGEDVPCVVAATGEQVPCHEPAFGWLDAADGCYYRIVEPPPPDGPYWEGHYPDGAIYLATCINGPRGIPGSNGGWVWRAAPPAGSGPTITPAQLAQQAVEQLALTGPAIRMTIEGDEMGIVGIPLWLWTEVGPATWGPASATASVPGLSVTATATARQIVWEMGDGRSVTCRSPGTPYYTGGVTSPTCQHIYEQTSAGQPNEAFPVTATTTWDVAWAGGGDSGSLTVTRSSTSSVRIGEVQVLVTQE